MIRHALVASLLVVAVPPTTAAGAQAPGPGSQQPDSAAVVAVVESLHRALATGDTATVRTLLAENAIVEEGGGLETRSEYFGHHLSADMEFAAGVESERHVARVAIHGDVAWVASTSRRTGTFRGREIDMDGAELMVLRRTPAGWRIAAIHWSSRSR